ncbi:MAG: site-specific integrase [Clostridia bacterium]|nr:site-specific integrase [Clostridia bacterium]
MPKYKHTPNGAGTVRKLSDNRSRPFQALAPAKRDPKTGKYSKREIIGYFETELEARVALTLFRKCPPTIDLNTTFSEAFEQWKAQGYRNISRSTIDVYNAAYAKFKPIYNFKIQDIKTPQLQFCVDAQVDKGLSHSSLQKMKVLAGLVENYAVQMDLIPKNYAEFIVLPKAEQEEKTIFTDFDLKKIAESAEDGNVMARHILIMCYTGWRIQEYLNLTIFDYDRAERTLKGGLKTEAGKNRVVPVPEKVRPYVEQFYSESDKLCNIPKRRFRTEFDELLVSLEIQKTGKNKITPHSTRHTYNSMLAKNGVNVETRMKLMGQVSEDVNRKVYTHTELNELKKAVKGL